MVASGKRATALLKKFAMKYYPDEQLADGGIARAGKAAQMFEIEIELLNGKEVQEKSDEKRRQKYAEFISELCVFLFALSIGIKDSLMKICLMPCFCLFRHRESVYHCILSGKAVQ